MLSFLRLSRAGQRVCCRAKRVNKNFKRNESWDAADAPQVYREQLPKHSKLLIALATFYPAFVTFYLGYNFYHHPEHVTGHYPKMEPSKWTDEELGIPPDDEDIYPPGYIPLKDRV
ncbi:NADH dehydrogenase [ubiquinone] 1 beta subcomplex subunit 2, mitochondrial-like [Mercenaria mercenaria]|uniref:NADH dehydrogenase [ubiquinone] 1 beta subcomplex subunit 2, mitochondrial-like n=1 Tax=Mercenaria mercenaria TaxID=6596 RepID=UPI00234E8C40|nr:NADH dehydrogenase [ubiquinone] 1 beta subcomplex subunit 2, mitochondrial-like [Mercenaria mercenaria]